MENDEPTTLDELFHIIDAGAGEDAEALRNKANIAWVIAGFKYASKEDRLQAKWRFEDKHHRSLAVWARIVDRFYGLPEFESQDPDVITALSYMCQLPEDVCKNVFYNELRGYLEDGGKEILPYVRQLVADNKPTRAAKVCPHCGGALEKAAKK